MSFLTRFFQDRPRPARVFSVRIKRNTQARRAGGNATTDVSPGEVIEVAEADAAELIAAGCAERVGRHAPERPAAKPKAASVPVPADYAALPVDFSEAWKLTATRDALVLDLDAAFRETMPKDYDQKDFIMGESRSTGPEGTRASEEKAKALEAARETLRTWDECHRDKLAGHLFKCGQLVLELIGAANTSSALLAETGLRIFMSRIASLELSEMKARQLFEGSGLALRYAKFTPIGHKGATFMGPGHGDTLDEPVAALAPQYRRAAARLAEVEKLLVEARAELAAAEGVNSPGKARKAA